MIVPGNDDRLSWSGAISLERRDDWVMPWRIPREDLDLFSSGRSSLPARAALPSGVRLRFGTDAGGLIFRTEPMIGPGSMDVCVDDVVVATSTFRQGDTDVRFANLPAGDKPIDLWLSSFVPFCLREIELSDGASFEERRDDRPRWVTYGSSITQCRTARSPAFTWPGIVARSRHLNLTSLGFGGNCHVDPVIARLIRDLPAELISLKIGINVFNQSSLSLRTFQPALIGMITTIRDRHPATPLVVCSPIWSGKREAGPNSIGMTLKVMRDEIRDAVASFAGRGDEKIRYVNGLTLLGEDAAELLPDGLHPSAAGYEVLAANFLKKVFGTDPSVEQDQGEASRRDQLTNEITLHAGPGGTHEGQT
ncbi:MAG: GDSL family lipase [Bradyrhizobium sp.]|uniref:SGNH/GDSL hydrolase family protein n=1 Tax=Bradyrhizobium sp. TaxID=376 RepID=UPI0025BC32EA|nr:SGNH/GDSL hydrolase family protein [Bradyrhizobium sp.]MBI5264120.1 GDSL family lipase [Bradyrhizobium sp.]